MYHPATRLLTLLELLQAEGALSDTGIGPFVVHELVRLRGGRIEVFGELGEGTMFAVWLPQARNATGAT